MRELLDEGLHLIGTKRAVQADHERRGMRSGSEKRLDRLPA